MNLRALLALVALLLATSVSAQNLQAIKPIQLTQPSSPDLAANDPATKIAKLETANQKLREENTRLQAENQALAQRVNDFSSLGGSQVHAYCPTPGGSVSRNTAGVETDCRGAGGYLCEPVSGLCRTSCQTSNMCAGGFTCDTAAQKCVYTGG